jgi:hypothetical protein
MKKSQTKLLKVEKSENMKKLQSSYSLLKTEFAITLEQSGFRHCEERNNPENKTHIWIASGCALIMTPSQSEKMAAGHEKIVLQHEKIALQHEKIVLQHEKIAQQHEKIALQHEKIAQQHEKIILQHGKDYISNNKNNKYVTYEWKDNCNTGA